VVLDHAPDLTEAVVVGDLDLNTAFRQAEDQRDAERRKLEEQERLAAEEADAKAFIEENAPNLAARVDGNDLLTYVEARDLWTRRNREEAERLRQERAAEERKERERLDGIKRDVNRLRNFLDGLATAATLHQHPYRSEVLDSLDKPDLTRV